MSDISTTLSMKGQQLFATNELLTCSMFNFKMFLFVLTILICISCITMSMNSIFAPIGYEETNRIHKCNEHFSNNLFFSDKDTINTSYSNYQSTSLTSDNALVFGQANRYIGNGNITKTQYILDIFANLYVLNGNPFGKNKLQIDPFEHKYLVYLKNTKTTNKLQIGKLKKDGDGMYKLHFESSEPNKYITFNEVEITYKTADKETVLLNGKFTIV